MLRSMGSIGYIKCDPNTLVNRKLVVPAGTRSRKQECNMATSNAKPHFSDSGEHFRDGKPCRACTDVKTWLKMTRNEKKGKQVYTSCLFL